MTAKPITRSLQAIDQNFFTEKCHEKSGRHLALALTLKAFDQALPKLADPHY